MERKLKMFMIVLLLIVMFRPGYTRELSVAAPEEMGMSSKKLVRIKPVVKAFVDNNKIAGAIVVIARGKKIVSFETFGMMDKEAKKPMRKDTIFRFYSMSKPITSVAAMMLYEKGKFKLDDPVSKYIPEFKGLKVYDKSGTNTGQVREMTVRDLFRHTSGLTYGLFGNTPVDKLYRADKVLDRASSLKKMVKKLGRIPLLYQPGTRWHYSVSVDVLGYLVQKLSGMPLDKFFKEKIFKPLDMKDTGFFVPAGKVSRFAACYGSGPGGELRVIDKPSESRFLHRPGLFSGGGGLVSTARDYMRFCEMLLNRGELNGKRLLAPGTVEMMTKNQLPENVTRGGGSGFGLGFSVRTRGGKYSKGEYGWGGAASTHFWISPGGRLIVLALSQYMPYSAQLENSIKPIIYDAIQK